MVMCACNPSCLGGWGKRIAWTGTQETEGCSEPRSRHCTTAWATEQDCLIKKKDGKSRHWGLPEVVAWGGGGEEQLKYYLFDTLPTTWVTGSVTPNLSITQYTSVANLSVYPLNLKQRLKLNKQTKRMQNLRTRTKAVRTLHKKYIYKDIYPATVCETSNWHCLYWFL